MIISYHDYYYGNMHVLMWWYDIMKIWWYCTE